MDVRPQAAYFLSAMAACPPRCDYRLSGSALVADFPASPEDMLSDLLRRCARGDKAALRTLYDQQAGSLLGLALRMLGDRRLAEEAVQDAFIQVWRNAGRFDPAQGSARSWMIGILRFRAIDMREAERRRSPTGTIEISDAETTGAVPGVDPPRFEDRQALLGCLGELKDGPRRSIVLAYLDGCSHPEIARHLSQPMGTVKSWILRGLAALRECLER